MAKRRRQQRVARARVSTVTADTAPASCKLRGIPASIDFGAHAGETVELFTHDHVGIVLMAKAEYGGEQLVPAGQATSRLTFEIRPGRNTLKMVFVFSASIAGRAELREQCSPDDSQFLRALAGDEPLQIMRIVGR